MLFSAIADLSKRKESELLVVPFWEKPTAATPLKTLAPVVKPPILAKDFTGKEGETEGCVDWREEEGVCAIVDFTWPCGDEWEAIGDGIGARMIFNPLCCEELVAVTFDGDG